MAFRARIVLGTFEKRAPGPFSQDRVNMQDGMLRSKWYAPFSSGWSLNSENRLPLCNNHSIRIIWLNGKHPAWV